MGSWCEWFEQVYAVDGVSPEQRAVAAMTGAAWDILFPSECASHE